MKILRWVLLLLGIASLFYFLKSIEMAFAGKEWTFASVKLWLKGTLNFPNIYYNAVKLFLQNRRVFLTLLTRNWGFSLNLLLPFLAYAVAQSRNRSGFWWWIVCSYLPFFAIMLALKPEGEEVVIPETDTSSSYSPSSYSSGSSSSYSSGSYYSSSKSCSACGKAVSLSASAGQSCPHCGAYWSTENTTYQN